MHILLILCSCISYYKLIFLQGAIFVYDITNEDSFKVVDQMLSVFKEVSIIDA